MSGAAVIQTAFLGDIVLTTPLIETLAAKYGPVDVVTTPENAPLIETLPTVKSIIPFDKRGADGGLRGIRRIASILRNRRLDYVFLPHESLRSAVVAWWAGIPNRIGFVGGPAAWLYTTRHRSPPHTHETERLHALADQHCAAPRPRIALTETDRQTAQRTLHAAGVTDHDYLVLAPGSRQPTKRWPYFTDLAEHLVANHDVVFVGGPGDAIFGRDVRCGPRVVANLAGALTIRETAAVIEGAGLVVCNDSVALHIAAAVGTQVVAIFGPTDPAMGFGPQGASDIVVGKRDLGCRPCSTHGGQRCPLRHHRCMVDLDVSTVANIVQHASRTETKR